MTEKMRSQGGEEPLQKTEDLVEHQEALHAVVHGLRPSENGERAGQQDFPIPSQILPKTFQAIWDVFFRRTFASDSKGTKPQRGSRQSR